MNIFTHRRLSLLFSQSPFPTALALLACLGACSSGPKIEEFPDTASAATEVQTLVQNMQSATERQVDVLAPIAFNEAHNALESSLKMQHTDPNNSKEILHRVAQARAYLNLANQSSDRSRSSMEEVVTARQAALSAGSKHLFPKELSKADSHLRSLATEFEDGDFGNLAEGRAKLLSEYRSVELNAIKESTLAPIRDTIAAAIKDGAKDHATQTLAIAEKKANDLEAFIVSNRHDSSVKSRADDALAAANHLVQITQASRAGKSISSEEVALRLERANDKVEAKTDQLTELRKTTSNLKADKSALKSDLDFNKAFEAARTEFSPEESEIYRQGDQLVIRLRKLNFPVNQSVLRGENFALLAKVAKVIKGFNNSTVVVEGHTDSDGSKAANATLSTERAKAVSDYLVSADAIERDKIKAVGYGFDRPLKPNKTALGRAENRRVDVVISPHSSETQNP